MDWRGPLNWMIRLVSISHAFVPNSFLINGINVKKMDYGSLHAHDATKEQSYLVQSAKAIILAIELRGRSNCSSYAHLIDLNRFPFTDWQNDLHLNLGAAQGHLLYLRLDLGKLITAATRVFSGTASIGSCEDRSGYVCCRVPH